MKIGEFLQHSNQRLVACLSDDLLNAVAKLLYTHNFGAMPVCELVGKPDGWHCLRADLVRAFARADWTEM